MTDAEVQAVKSKARRDRLRAGKLCVNGEKHGPATHGVRCRACYLKHRGISDITPPVWLSLVLDRELAHLTGGERDRLAEAITAAMPPQLRARTVTP